ncbi:N-acetyltransferase [Plantactinospora sp. BC1]|uniref:GNAT family N-acetyltransferase n=1 Tax=Plantactinospora sp. BC1 TaxID=2108470 RepID=UPI0018FEDDD7|nr:GNAT family N-acetyltransferase [Plantactinospora sp. BC1]
MTLISVGRDDPELATLLSAELEALNRAAIVSDDELPFAVRLTDDAGALLGGITGWTWGGCGGITSLWLAVEERGKGLGGRLLAAAEDEIRRRGCDRVVVATMSFQAPDFYRRHGYREVGRTPEMPDGTAKHHFHKRLDADSPDSRRPGRSVPESHARPYPQREGPPARHQIAITGSQIAQPNEES